MTPFKPQGKHKRTIILYSLAMILPGVILSIIAFRGIQGNMAMTEKTQSLKLVNICQDFYENLEGSISETYTSTSWLAPITARPESTREPTSPPDPSSLLPSISATIEPFT